jgi:hypothetical protein
MDRWENVAGLLLERRGPNADVAVYPNADIQYTG